MENKRPTALTVYIILSWIWITVLSYNVLMNYVAGPMTAEQIRENRIEMLKSLEKQPQQDREVGMTVVNEMELFFETYSANHAAAHFASFLHILVGLAATILMFRMRKVGFHLYILYSLIPITTASYFYGASTIGVGLMFCSGVIGLLFIILYGFQLKHLK